ncbi:E3 ubiquitin-protein ligase TRAIP-like [Branchiostoma floridae]|uniref:E3 ubiquitin-protein ligase TRAIP-like n=1 Tax=Branchiostoma floridae TaxID=7739 RepID=A0A9J7NBX1_BRAFL|nr:E3 ubiquitin-protein ligase TRAIP-like [Branchiostoma floridae]
MCLCLRCSLSRWLHTPNGNSCPQCRTKVTARNIISKLFFDQPDEDAEEDPSVLRNELTAAKAKLSEKDKEKRDLTKEKDKLEDRLVTIRVTLNELSEQLQDEQDKNKTLKQQMKLVDIHKKQAQQAEVDAKKLRKKLVELERLQLLIKGSSSEAEDMIQDMGEGAESARSLARHLTVLKKEHEKVKEMRRKSAEEAERYRKELSTKRVQCAETTKELQVTQDQLRDAKQQIQNLTAKNKMLKQELAEGKSTPGSRATTKRLLLESPAPLLIKKPCLDGAIYLDDETIMPVTPEEENFTQRRNNARLKREKKEFDWKPVKTTSVAETVKKDLRDIGNFDLSPYPHHQMGARTIRETNHRFGAVNKGYNGMGGHEKILNLQPRIGKPLPKKSKFVSRSRASVPSRDPALPTLDDFITS